MIWQIIDSSGVGGAERHIENLATSLEAHGLPVTVVLIEDHGANPWLEQLSRAGVMVTQLDGRFASLLAAIRRHHPVLIHTHGYKAGILGRTAARLAGIPVVSTFHSGQRGAFPVGAYEWLDDWTSFSGARIAVSAEIAARLPFKATVVPSYVRTEPVPPCGALGEAVGFVGRLSAEKGPDLFCRLAAAAQEDARFANLTWHVWGDGPMRRQLELDFGTRINFHGVATDMRGVWHQVGLLCMTSRFEGVPLAALEASAQGIPVLASRVGGLPTIIVDGSTGWLFPGTDVGAALDGLAAWDRRRQTDPAGLRAACWAKARADFSEARWLPEILAVYQSCGVAMPASSRK